MKQLRYINKVKVDKYKRDNRFKLSYLEPFIIYYLSKSFYPNLPKKEVNELKELISSFIWIEAVRLISKDWGAAGYTKGCDSSLVIDGTLPKYSYKQITDTVRKSLFEDNPHMVTKSGDPFMVAIYQTCYDKAISMFIDKLTNMKVE